MNILGIDTTKKQAYIFGVFGSKKVVNTLNSYERHSEHLLTHVEEVLSDNGLSVKDIDVFANVSGPGSFTGIRIGLTTVKALNFPFKKKVVNFSVFDALRKAVKNGILLLECTSSSVYYCKYNNSKVGEYGVWQLNEMPEEVLNEEVYVLSEEQLHLKNSYKINVIDNYAEYVMDAIMERCDNKAFTTNPLPFYIALSQAEKNLLLKEQAND